MRVVDEMSASKEVVTLRRPCILTNDAETRLGNGSLGQTCDGRACLIPIKIRSKGARSGVK